MPSQSLYAHPAGPIRMGTGERWADGAITVHMRTRGRRRKRGRSTPGGSARRAGWTYGSCRPMSVAHARPAPSAPPTLAEYQDPAVHRDPYPFYARLRRECPMLSFGRGSMSTPSYLASRYDDVLFVLKDERFGSDRRSAGLEP